MKGEELRAWLQRAESFVRQLNYLPGEWGISVRVEPPISDAKADRLAAKLPLGLPAPLRALYVEGAAAFKCTYHWKPPKSRLPLIEAALPHQYSFYGGARFIPCEELLSLHGIHTWWDGVEAESEEQEAAREVWRQTVPFINVGNGDAVGLHVSDDHERLPVVYLCHDDPDQAVTEISPSFDRFLIEWEKLRYIGPESWLLGAFLSRRGERLLNGESKKARQWRNFLAGAARKG